MAVTTLGGATDGHVRSIKRLYDNMARLEKLTSYQNADATGTVRNEIQYVYNDFSQVATSYQSHEGAVSTMSTPSVQYTYDATASSNVFSRQHRPESLIYPNGRTVFYDYDTANADYPSNRLSRIRKIREANVSGTELVAYDYSGIDSLAVIDLPQPDLKLDYFQGTSGTYSGLDRFGRVKDQYWDGYGSTADVDRFHYAYDYASNRTYRDIDAAIYATNNKDQAYTYDGLDRLKTFDEGTLSGSTLSGSTTKEEDWTLDAMGNWAGFLQKSSGSTDLDQARTHNKANEITDITESTGPSWATPAHDAAGNMTTIPKPADMTGSFTATYDAFNRLVKLADGITTIAEYEYDGLSRRILKAIFSSGSLDHVRHAYFSEGWHVLEERFDSSSSAERQSVWGPNYIDELVLRDRDADGNTGNGLEERLYVTRNTLFNVTALVDAMGTVSERFTYMPYGESLVNDPNFAPDADEQSDFNWETLFTGREFDAESGLFHFRLRQYHSQIGRFVSRDPLAYYLGERMLFAYARGNPIRWTDPYGLDVLLKAHGVAAGKNHCKVVIIPDDQEKWKDHPLFNNILDDGRHFMTLGAGPENVLKLVSAPNRDRDVSQTKDNKDKYSKDIPIPQGMTEDDLIDKLIEHDNCYPDNLTYPAAVIPAPISKSYNSKSYVNGLLQSLDIYMKAPPNSPGFTKPVPKRFFICN